jgi:hypothetical protein
MVVTHDAMGTLMPQRRGMHIPRAAGRARALRAVYLYDLAD